MDLTDLRTIAVIVEEGDVSGRREDGVCAIQRDGAHSQAGVRAGCSFVR